MNTYSCGMNTMGAQMGSSLAGQRQDTFQTSTGVGHHLRPGFHFPSAKYQSILREPLPPPLAKTDEITNDQRFETTTGLFHDDKFHCAPYKEPQHFKAPGHWKVNYVKDVAEKLGKGGWRKPLTMGHQLSEKQDQYSAKSGLNLPNAYHPGPQPFNLKNHHLEGPSKTVIPSTQNEELRGRPFMVRDRGVLNLNDMYLTTTNKDHRSWSRHELDGVSKKDVPTYWQCEEYTKAWGHGLHENPLPKDTVPREKLPMTDPTFFKYRTKIGRLPTKFVPVPHMGLKSEVKHNYTKPSDVKMRDIYYCPIDTPYILPAPGPKSVFTAPQMYKTEYQNVGNDQVITV